jgi:hypothetical protein
MMERFPLSTQISPTVSFFSGRSNSYVQCGAEWHRLTPDDDARLHTGFDRETREPSLGVSIVRRPNGLVRVAFDLARLDVRLHPSAIERLEARWRGEAASLSRSLLRSVNRRAHFARSFVQFEVAPENVEGWKRTLEARLSNPDSYESIEPRTEPTL